MNIALLLDVASSMVPERVAVSDGAGSLTYAELADRARRWAAWIASAVGTAPVLYVGTARTETVEVLFGCAIAGVPFIPVSYRARAAELAAYLVTAAPGAVLADARYQVLVGRMAVDPATATLPAPSTAEPPEDGRAVCLFTSGTTAAPKLTVLSHGNLSSYVLNTTEAGSASAAEAVLISTPPYHIAWVANVLSNVFRGRRLVLRPQFEPREWLETIREERVTHAMVVPTMLGRILDALEADPALLPDSLVNLAYGGARAPEGLAERALATLPASVGLVNAFGLTETSSTVALLGPEHHRAAFASADPAVRSRLRSVGKPVPGIEIRIADPVGAPVQTGEAGQLWIRGAQVASEYVGRSVVDAEGWLRTGDRAWLDGDGFLFVTGRGDDIIIRGGENIDPAEIEDVLLQHPAVREAAVIGLDDAEWGQVVAALVAGDRSTDEEQLRSWVRERLGGPKTPVRIGWVDALPRTDTGKVVRRDARAMLVEAKS